MLYAADFRELARNALKGRWGVSVVAGLIAVVLGGTSSYSNSRVNIDSDSISELENQLAGGEFADLLGQDPELARVLAGVGVAALVLTLVIVAASIFLGNVVGVGYHKFNLDLVDGKKEPEIGTLFNFFPRWKTLVGAGLLKDLYIFLWTLLLFIPGIIAIYDYAMTGFILAEHPELTASQALAKSKQIMRGNRRRLFWLEMSFFGWAFLCALSLGIGFLWLRPYQQAAFAEFYRDITAEPKNPGGEALSWNQSLRGGAEYQIEKLPTSDDI